MVPETVRVPPAEAVGGPVTGVLPSSGHPSPPPLGAGPLTPGQNFGPRYHIIKLLGAGGMGAVYQAWDAELGIAVAIKVVRPEAADDPEAARDLERRFKRELVLARQVTHRNVVRIHDLGEIEGIKYITMPFVSGRDLDSILKEQGRLPVPKALAVMRQVVAGLQAAHEAGVVHRDLKPANVMIEGEQVLVMDFGIARSVSGGTMATVAGGVMGTLDYMAPEQARGELVDQRADVYALGLMFYDLILGRRAAVTDNPVSDLMARMKAAPPSARSIDGLVPEGLDAIITRCLQPDPAARYQTSAELAAALGTLDADGRPMRVARRRESRRMLVAGVSALVLLVAFGAWLAGRRTAPAPATVHEPVSVLIANFTNQTGDAVFEGSLEQTLALGIEGASFVESYPRQAAQRLVAQISPGAQLNEDGARLVSVREGIKVILAGSIAPAGSGYRIAVNVVDPAEGKTIVTADASAADKTRVLEAIQKIASRIRSELGDTSPESHGAAPETYTAGTLEAAREYAQAQDLAAGGKDEEAIAHYRDAVALDDKFGRAFAGWAVSAYHLGRRDEAEEQWKKAVSLMERMTEREKYRTLGTYYLGVTRNYEKAVENYEALVKAYPGDGSGANNLGVAYFSVLNLPKAVEQGRRAVQLYPRNARYRTNLALYLMYSADFGSAAVEALQLVKDNPSTFKAYLPMAIAALAAGKPDTARQAYEGMAKVSAQGTSLARMGEADVAMSFGRYEEAEDILKRGMESDDATKLVSARAIKLMAFAEAEEALGHKAAAIAAAREALKTGRADAVVVPAARLLARTGQDRDAASLAAGLDRQLLKQSRAYARLIEAENLLARGRRADAIDALNAARQLADLWLVRFVLGRTYVESDAYAEALSELELCQKRRGEATAVFLDDVPSFRYLVPLSYWLARAQDGLGQKDAAAANYKAFLAVRGHEPGDPLVADARRRLGSP